jgi:hypothetical protein
LRYQPHVRVTEVDYNLLLREPDAQAQQIGLFLGPQVNARECRLVAMGRHPTTSRGFRRIHPEQQTWGQVVWKAVPDPKPTFTCRLER